MDSNLASEARTRREMYCAEKTRRAFAAQNRFISERAKEKRSVNARFDEERARLAPLLGPRLKALIRTASCSREGAFFR